MKLKRFYLSLLFFTWLLSFNGYSSENIDSLLNVLQSSVGEKRASCLNDIAEYYSSKNTSKAREYVDEAKNTAIRAVSKKEETRAVMISAHIYFNKQKYDDAFIKYEEALKLSEEVKDNLLKSDILNQLGKIKLRTGDYESAIRYFIVSLKWREKENAQKEIGHSLINIGIAYKNWHRYDSALYYLSDAKKWFEQIGESPGVAQATSNIGSMYFLMREYDKALKNYFEAVALLDTSTNALQCSKAYTSIGTVYNNMNDYENAITYYEKSLNIKRKVADSTDVAFTLNVIGNTYLKMNKFIEALKYYNQALQLRLYFGGHEDIASSYNNLGNVYKQLKKPDSASYYYSYALKLRKESGNKVKIAESYNYLGNANWEAKNFNKALEYYLLALDLRKELANNIDVAKSLNNIGLIYKDLKSFRKALDYYNKALEIYEKLNDELLTASQLNNIGSVYWEMEEYGKALAFYGNALEIRKKLGDKQAIASTLKNIGIVLKDTKDFNNANDKFVKALNLYKEINDSLNYAWTLNYYGNLFREKGQETEAMAKYSEAFKLMKKFNNANGIANVSKNIGESLMREKKYNRALDFLLIAVENAAKTGDAELNMNANYVLSEVYEKIGDFRNAHKSFSIYANAYNQFINTESLKKFSEIQLEYELAQKEKELKHIKTENELKLIKERHFRIVLIFIIIFLLLVALIIFFRYRLKSNAQTILQLKNKELEKAFIKLQKSEAEVKHSNQTKDKLFSLIAHDLKNPISNIASMVNMLKQRWDETDNNKKIEYIDVLQTSSHRAYCLLENLLTWARSQSSGFTLKPDPISIHELMTNNIKLLENYVKEKNIELLFEGSKDAQCYADKNMLDAVLRNLLSNSVKFTNKGYVKVIVEETDDKSTIVIEDTGIGISEKDLQKFFRPNVDYNEIGDSDLKGTGFGLTLVKEFLDRNNGTIFVESEEGKGSRFIISVPKKRTI